MKGNKVHRESKKDMKERLGGDASSPDIADALACTFYLDVAPTSLQQDGLWGRGQQVQHEYDPLKHDPGSESGGRKHDLPSDRYLVPMHYIS